MLKVVFIAILVSFYGNAQNIIEIKDENFAVFLNENFPNCMNSNQLNTTCPEIISTESLILNALKISNLDGLQAFVNLKSLECVENNLVYLPTLPTTLVKLDCSMNQLITLPQLPSTLEELSCAVNQLKALPILPINLKIVYCNFNQITTLPTLPTTLEYLACGSNKITCLPVLPSSIFIGDITLNPITCLANHTEWMDQESLKIPICNEQDQNTNLNRCICISTTLLSIEKTEDLKNSQLGVNILGNDKNNQIENGSDILIYPNPTEGNVIVQSKELINSIIVKDIEGKLIKLNSKMENISLNQVNLDLTELTNGVYFFETSTTNTLTIYKVIKTN